MTTISLQAQSERYLAKLQERKAKLQNSFTNFLKHKTRKLLIIETGNMVMSVLSVQNSLGILDETLKSQYVEGGNNLFLSWTELVANIGDVEAIPKFHNLMVIEIDKSAMHEKDTRLLKKIVERLSMGPSWKKVVLITREKRQLNNVLEETQSDLFSFMKEPGFKMSESLCEAASEGLLEKVEELIEDGADIDQVNDVKNTALHVAVENGYTDVVSKLLKYGASHLYNWYQDTALHLAAQQGHVNVMMLLLEHGIDVNIMGGDNKSSPLHYASESGHKEVVLKLLQHGAKYLQNDSNDTPLHLAALNGHGETVIVLLEHGADVNAANNEKRTPLYNATMEGFHDVVQTLILYDANIHALDRQGWTALHCAASYGQKTVANILLESGAQVFAKDFGGSIPLHHAASNGHLEVVKLMIEEKNVNLNCRNDNDETPLDLAKNKQYTEVVAYLKSQGAE